MPALIDRVHGTMLGQLAGDALGSMVEFKSPEAIRRLYPAGLRTIGPSPVWETIAGQPTDDSELALALARTLAGGDAFDDDAVASAYVAWLESGPFDVGGTIRQATSAMVAAHEVGGPPAAAGREAASRVSEANGALMRQSPLAIWGHVLPPEDLDRVVRADTTLTHPNRVCQDASAAFIVALAAVIREGLNGEDAYRAAVGWDRAYGSSPSVTEALARAAHSLPAFTSHSGHVIIALQSAFYQALHAPSFEEGVVQTVMGGGDTDTNGAIAGALLGAIHGAAAVPQQWREAILSCRPERGQPDVRRPRPEDYWPVDALALATRLAARTR